MNFLYPGFLIAAGAVSAAVVVLHLLVTQQPRSEDLPTVRFVPDVPARSTSVAIRPSDLLLLLLRVLMIMAIGAAFAQPQLKPKRQAVARIVMVDASRAVKDMKEVADSATPLVKGAAAVVVFDSVAREVTPAHAPDSLAALAAGPKSARRGMLSTAMITGLRAAARVRDAADSIEMVVVSPLVGEERDAATDELRNLWPGHIRVVRVAGPDQTADADAAKNTPRPRVEWADSAKSTMWQARAKTDTIGAVRAGTSVMVYNFARRWQPAAGMPDSLTRVYARWDDGEPAAFERINGNDCVRSIAFSLPNAGDAILRPDFVRFVDGLSAPCGVTRDILPLPEAFVSAFSGPAALAPVSSIKPRETRMTPLVPWLLGGALLLALLELLVRRMSGDAAASREAELTASRPAAKPVTGAAA